jgi:hypothetical protein
MDITVSIVIAQPNAAVFDFVSRYANDPAWRAGIIEMTQTPPGRPQVGVKMVEVGRFFGMKMVTVGEVTRYAPDREIAFAGRMADGTHVSGQRMVEPARGASEQTHFTYQLTVRLRGTMRLFGPVMAASMQRRCANDLRRLKNRLEAASEVAPQLSSGAIVR